MNSYDLNELNRACGYGQPRRQASHEETSLLMLWCDEHQAELDRRTAEWERSAELRRRQQRRERRREECGVTAFVCFAGCFLILVGPSVIAKWPLESLGVVAAGVLVACVARLARRASTW